MEETAEAYAPFHPLVVSALVKHYHYKSSGHGDEDRPYLARDFDNLAGEPAGMRDLLLSIERRDGDNYQVEDSERTRQVIMTEIARVKWQGKIP